MPLTRTPDSLEPLMSSSAFFSALLCRLRLSPLLMAVICESLRLAFRLAKLRIYPSFKPIPQEDVELRALSMAPGSPVEEKMEMGGFLGGVAAYHLLCGSLVALAVSNSWISSHAGGGVAWELWAIWQQLCLWTLFLQNLLRCCMVDAEALGASTWKAVLLYTVPCVSDLFDTMKDWLITGICFLEPRTTWGFPVGALLVSLELTLLLAGRLPRCIPLHEEISLIIRIGFGVYYTILITRNPQDPILIIKALH